MRIKYLWQGGSRPTQHAMRLPWPALWPIDYVRYLQTLDRRIAAEPTWSPLIPRGTGRSPGTCRPDPRGELPVDRRFDYAGSPGTQPKGHNEGATGTQKAPPKATRAFGEREGPRVASWGMVAADWPGKFGAKASYSGCNALRLCESSYRTVHHPLARRASRMVFRMRWMRQSGSDGQRALR